MLPDVQGHRHGDQQAYKREKCVAPSIAHFLIHARGKEWEAECRQAPHELLSGHGAASMLAIGVNDIARHCMNVSKLRI